MGMGPIAWCSVLLLSVHQAPPQENFLNARDFEIGIRIDPQRLNSLRQLTLLVSHDRGTTWEAGPQTPPTEKAFRYHAKEDGPYWFIVQEEDLNQRLNPRDPARARPSQCLIVDTTNPKIDVTAEHLANGDIHARWTITEQHPEERSLRLDYHTNAMRPDQWTPLPSPTSLQGEKQFNPGNGVREVTVRVRLQDRAGNSGQGEAKVAVTGAGVAAVASPGGASEGPSIGVIPTMRSEPTATPGTLTSRQTPRPTSDAGPQGLPLPSGGPQPMPSPPEELSSGGRTPAVETPAAASPERPAAPGGAAAETPNGALPALKIVNKREVRLDFEVAKVGPSGLGGADVYVTLNEGASWNKLPNELPLNWPAGADQHSSTPVRGSVSVQLPNEKVIYGFIVAVKSKAGLARPAPKPGEPPQVRIELDASAPKAQLFGPVPDTSRPNSLILAWSATDRNLTENPVTLEWAERKEGPWNAIGEQMPNSSATGALPPEATGSYVWQLPATMPSRVYLKLTARDTAGNVAVAQADKPVLIDLSVPETRNIVVAPH